MKIVEDSNPCNRTGILMLTLGFIGGMFGLCTGVVTAAKLVGRKHPPVR